MNPENVLLVWHGLQPETESFRFFLCAKAWRFDEDLKLLKTWKCQLLLFKPNHELTQTYVIMMKMGEKYPIFLSLQSNYSTARLKKWKWWEVFSFSHFKHLLKELTAKSDMKLSNHPMKQKQKRKEKIFFLPGLHVWLLTVLLLIVLQSKHKNRNLKIEAEAAWAPTESQQEVSALHQILLISGTQICNGDALRDMELRVGGTSWWCLWEASFSSSLEGNTEERGCS